MSHTTKLDTLEIKDIEALKTAVQNLAADGVNISLIQNALPRMHTSDQARSLGKCDYVIRLPDCQYDIGLKQEGELYRPYLDTWGNQIGGQIGAHGAACPANAPEAQKQMGKLLQEYGLQAAMNAARNQGHQVMGITTTPDGKKVLQLAVFG